MWRELAGDCGRSSFRLLQKKFSQKFCTPLYQFQSGTQTDKSFRPQSCQHTGKSHKRHTTEELNSCFKKKVCWFGESTPIKNCCFLLDRFAVGRNIREIVTEQCPSVQDCSVAT